MRLRFIKPALFVLLGIFIGMYFLRCGNDTGIGSDFDATKYYTKDQIDTMMAQYYAKSEIDNLISKNKSSIIMGVTNFSAYYDVYSVFHLEGNVNNSSIVIPHDGILKNLYVYPRNTTPDEWIVDICLTVNGIDTDLKLQYTYEDGTIIKENTVDTVSVTEGDLVSIHYNEKAGYSAPLLVASLLFDADI